MPIAEIKLRRGTTVDWLLVDPVLDAGEPGYDLTTKRIKVGDGTTPWSGLLFQTVDPSTLTTMLAQVDDAVATAEAAADTASDAAAAAAAVPTTSDGITAGLVNDLASQTTAALDGHYDRDSYFDAEKYKTGTNTDLQAIQAACAAASADPNARGASVRLSSRVWDVGAGLSMNGYSCGLVGMGVSYNTSASFGLSGSVLWASAQAGAVLDMTGWAAPASFRGAVEFGKFGVKGNNVADPTKANAGIKNTGAAQAGMWWHDIVIDATGGPCVDYKDIYVSVMERVTCCTPVGANANDVPYLIVRGNNGTTFNSIGFRSMVTGLNTGPGGALVVTDDGVSAASNSKWNSTWFENLDIANGGCLIRCEGNNHQFAGTYFTDEGIDAGATNTCYVWFKNVVNGSNYGGNTWRGLVPGNGGSVGITTGIKVSQKAQRIEGGKAYNGANVTLDAGVTGCYVSIGGSIQGVQGGPSAFVDNSGNTTNTLLDFYNYPNVGLPGPGTGTQTLTSTSTLTPNSDLYTRARVTAQTGTLTIANPTGTPLNGQGLIIRVKDNGTARSLLYGTQYRAVGVILPTTTVPNKTLYLGCIWNSDDTRWDVIALAQEV